MNHCMGFGEDCPAMNQAGCVPSGLDVLGDSEKLLDNFIDDRPCSTDSTSSCGLMPMWQFNMLLDSALSGQPTVGLVHEGMPLGKLACSESSKAPSMEPNREPLQETAEFPCTQSDVPSTPLQLHAPAPQNTRKRKDSPMEGLSTGPQKKRLKRKRKHPGTKRPYNDLLSKVQMWDFEIPAGPEINCTAVELIVLLPKWFQNRWLATRFVSNGIHPPIHRAMLQAHRTFDPKSGQDFKRNTILIGYRNAMRGHGWEQQRLRRRKDFENRRDNAISKGVEFTEVGPRDEPEWEWNRMSHKVPDTWDQTAMSINGFVPDRIRLQRVRRDRPGIPFRHLMTGVRVLPKGPDAADLTRALQYAVSNERPASEGCFEEYLFPDHFHEILDIIGRTPVTPDHHDSACIKRYGMISQGKNLPKRNRTPRPAVAEQNTEKEDSELTEIMEKGIRLQSPLSIDTSVERFHGHSSPLMHPAHEIQPPIYFIRDDNVPQVEDYSHEAQIVRFAQRPDQVDTDFVWCDGHVMEISEILTNTWIRRLNALLDQSGRPLWRHVGVDRSYCLDQVTQFTNRGMQKAINWRVDHDHARILGHIDISVPEMTLESLADVVLNFGQYSHHIGRLHGNQFQEATDHCLRIFGKDAS